MIKNKVIAILAILILSTSWATAQTKDKKDQEKYFEINKNIDIYASILRELDMLYVDSLDLTKTVRTGIDNMLNSLDPYTEYYAEEDMTEFKLMTTGEYAGIGSGIVFKDSMVCITEPFEGKPAAKAGLKAGDYILEIDGKDMTKCERKAGEPYAKTLNTFVSSHLKGQPGTSIKVKVQRPGEKKPLILTVTREIISVGVIPYYGVLDSNTGYISLTGFTDKSALKVKEAFNDLKKQGITSLIFDLRNNGGGIMEDAIEIVNMFVPKGKVVLSTKGKVNIWDRTYRTTIDPIDTQIPIAVLIDNASASASEIVAGSLQDMDRAVLIGQRTFGKGLVQSPREVPYGGSVKITTSKYYIPSGRCVQAIDYSHKNADGSAARIADSLTSVFHTEVGREVRDGGGVSPDIEVKEDKVPNITYYLANQLIVFDWVTQWAIDKKEIEAPKLFSITEQDYASFKEFVKSKDFQYDRISEKSMKSLKDVMEFEGYMKSAEAEFKALEAMLVPNLDRDLSLFQKEITDLINAEIVKRFYYQKGEKIYSFNNDVVLNKAIEVLNNEELYKQTLSPPVKEALVKEKEDGKKAK